MQRALRGKTRALLDQINSKQRSIPAHSLGYAHRERFGVAKYSIRGFHDLQAGSIAILRPRSLRMSTKTHLHFTPKSFDDIQDLTILPFKYARLPF